MVIMAMLLGTMMPTSGKWFCEFHFNAAGAGQDNGIGFWSIV